MNIVASITEDVDKVIQASRDRVAKTRDRSKKNPRRFGRRKRNNPKAQMGMRQAMARMSNPEGRKRGRQGDKMAKWERWFRNVGDPESRLQKRGERRRT